MTSPYHKSADIMMAIMGIPPRKNIGSLKNSGFELDHYINQFQKQGFHVDHFSEHGTQQQQTDQIGWPAE